MHISTYTYACASEASSQSPRMHHCPPSLLKFIVASGFRNFKTLGSTRKELCNFSDHLLYLYNGLRIGTQEITRRGFTPAHQPAVAALMRRALIDREPPERIRADAVALRREVNATA